jgi:hypothetical protein
VSLLGKALEPTAGPAWDSADFKAQ